MRTNEFIKKVKGLGFDVLSHYDCIDIGTDVHETIASVSVDEILSVDTDWSGWHDLSKIQKGRLFDLLVEYAKTQIEERKEPKKYYLRHRWISGGFPNYYLNIYIDNNKSFIHDKTETSISKAQFTREEIDEIKEKYNN